MATAKEIWDTLSKINVNEHTEKKGNLTYLSWAWAWGELMKHYPQATYSFGLSPDPQGVLRDAMFYQDGSASVECLVKIDDVERTMTLPVMDNRNNAIQNPNARQISDTKMRCLVKCIAMFGLGHYIYAGEDLPEGMNKPLRFSGPKQVLRNAAGLKRNDHEPWKKILEDMRGQQSVAELEAWKREKAEEYADFPHGYSYALQEQYENHMKDLQELEELAKEAAE